MTEQRLRSYFTDLDGMRGILAVVVMLFHIGLNPLMVAATGGLLTRGLWTLCVDFFFILSGFVLYFSIERTRPDGLRYFVKRLRRLAPVFMIGTVAMLLLEPGQRSLALLAANFAMVQSIIGLPSIDHPSWSIPFELFLPALVLPVIGLLSRSSPRVTVSIVAVLLALAAVFTVLLALGRDIQLGRAFCGLALGMVLGRLRQMQEPGPERPWLVLALFASSVAIMALAIRFPPLAAAFPLVSAICIFFGAQTRTILSTAPFQALGRWSYSIYLLHIPVVALVGATLGSVDGNAALKGVVVVGTIALAAFVFRFVEQPLMQGRPRPAETAP